MAVTVRLTPLSIFENSNGDGGDRGPGSGSTGAGAWGGAECGPDDDRPRVLRPSPRRVESCLNRLKFDVVTGTKGFSHPDDSCCDFFRSFAGTSTGGPGGFGGPDMLPRLTTDFYSIGHSLTVSINSISAFAKIEASRKLSLLP